MFLTAFLFQRAYWIVSAGPLGHLKQSLQKTFPEQRSTSTRWRALKPKKLFRNCTYIAATSLLRFGRVLIFRRGLNSDPYRKSYRKTRSRKRLWTTLADRRRAGPPDFRRKYRQQPNATLSFPSWFGVSPNIHYEAGVGAPCRDL